MSKANREMIDEQSPQGFLKRKHHQTRHPKPAFAHCSLDYDADSAELAIFAFLAQCHIVPHGVQARFLSEKMHPHAIKKMKKPIILTLYMLIMSLALLQLSLSFQSHPLQSGNAQRDQGGYGIRRFEDAECRQPDISDHGTNLPQKRRPMSPSKSSHSQQATVENGAGLLDWDKTVITSRNPCFRRRA